MLRDGRPDARVELDEDRRPEAFHLGVRADDGRVIAVATFFQEPCPHRPGKAAWRLRGMAVEPGLQRSGAGTLLLDTAVARLRAEGVEVVWAHGRDSALGFYERRGWRVYGEGYATDETGLPHHDVVLDLL